MEPSCKAEKTHEKTQAEGEEGEEKGPALRSMSSSATMFPRTGLFAENDIAMHTLIGFCKGDSDSAVHSDPSPGEYPFFSTLNWLKMRLLDLPVNERTLKSIQQEFSESAQSRRIPIPHYVLALPSIVTLLNDMERHNLSRNMVLQCWEYTYSRLIVYYHFQGSLQWIGGGWLSSLNHSCNPNAFLFFAKVQNNHKNNNKDAKNNNNADDDDSSPSSPSSPSSSSSFIMHLTSLQGICKGTQITIDYFAHLSDFRLADYKERRRVIRQFYGFECCCSRCIEESSCDVDQNEQKQQKEQQSKQNKRTEQNDRKERIDLANAIIKCHVEKYMRLFAEASNMFHRSAKQTSIAWSMHKSFEIDWMSEQHFHAARKQMQRCIQNSETGLPRLNHSTKIVFQTMWKTRKSDRVQNIYRKFPWRNFIEFPEFELDDIDTRKRLMSQFASWSIHQRWIALVHSTMPCAFCGCRNDALINSTDSPELCKMCKGREFPNRSVLTYILTRQLMVMCYRKQNVEEARDELDKRLQGFLEGARIPTTDFVMTVCQSIHAHFPFAVCLKDHGFIVNAVLLWPRLEELKKSIKFPYVPLHRIFACLAESPFFKQFI